MLCDNLSLSFIQFVNVACGIYQRFLGRSILQPVILEPFKQEMQISQMSLNQNKILRANSFVNKFLRKVMLPCLAVIIINDISTVIFDRSFCIEHIPWDVKYIYQIQDKRTFDYLQICNSNQNNNHIMMRHILIQALHYLSYHYHLHRIYS